MSSHRDFSDTERSAVKVTADGETAPSKYVWAASFTSQRPNLNWQGLMGRSARSSGYGTFVLSD